MSNRKSKNDHNGPESFHFHFNSQFYTPNAAATCVRRSVAVYFMTRNISEIMIEVRAFWTKISVMFNKEKPPSTVDTKTCTVNTTRGRITKVVELPPSDGSDSPLNYIFSIRATVQQAGIVFNSMHILSLVLLRRFKRRRLPVDKKKKKKNTRK